MLNITDTTNSFMVDEKTAIDLELKLNVTKYAHTWKSIGDVLYDFGARKPNAINNLIVTTEQYDYLTMLMKEPSWKTCKGL
jgi:hypothetical protein